MVLAGPSPPPQTEKRLLCPQTMATTKPQNGSSRLPSSWCRQPGPGTDTVGQTVHQAKMSQGLSPSGMFSVAVKKCAGLCRNEKMLVTMLRLKAGVQSCIYNVTATLKKKMLKKMLKKRSPEGNTPTCEQQLSFCSKMMGYFFLLPCAFYTPS